MKSKNLTNFDNNSINNSPKKSPENNTKDTVNQTATSPKIGYAVAHAIPGRIRFRIPRLGKDADYANQLQQLIKLDSRIKHVRINPVAASIVISYQTGIIADEKMRSHLVYLIQNAPNIALPAKATTKPIVGAIFDALINMIDSTRKINQARHANTYQQPRKDIWERVLKSAKTFLKGIKSATMFFMPSKRWPSTGSGSEVRLQPSPS